MTHKRRRPTPQGDDTGPASEMAQRPLQRRLRPILGYVDWRDAFAGALLGELLDALGGSAVPATFWSIVQALLDT